MRRKVNFTSMVLATLVLVVALGACNKDRSVLPLNDMKKVLWDMTVVESFNIYYIEKSGLQNRTAEANKKYAAVLQMHDVSAERFFYSLDYYRKQPQKFRVLLDSVNAYGTRQRDANMEAATQPEQPHTKKIVQPTQ